MKKIKVTWPRPVYYKNKWLTLEDGGSERWLYAVSNGMVFVFIEIHDWYAACGKEAQSLFNCTVKVVDLTQILVPTIMDALKFCGIESIDKEVTPLVIAQCCLSYGASAVMWDEYGGKVTERFEFGGYDEKHPAFRKLRSDARKYAEENLFDDDERNALMDTNVVNAMGATAKEYMSGDLWGVLRKAKENPTPQQALVLKIKIYSKCERTLGGEEIPQDLRE